MTWFKVDDQLGDHPKIMGLGDDRLPALGLWTICGTYAAKHLTDGFVPQSAVTLYGGSRWQRLARALVRVGLLEEVAGGYRMHDFLDYNPSRQKVNEDRAKKRAAGQAGGQASAQARAGARGSEGDQHPTRPDPPPARSGDFQSVDAARERERSERAHVSRRRESGRGVAMESLGQIFDGLKEREDAA